MKNLIEEFKSNYNNKATMCIEQSKLPSNFTKQKLWEAFNDNFVRLYGKKLMKTPEIIQNIQSLFYYFLQDEKFFECTNLYPELSQPSFKKGLLIIGGYGTGKTAMMLTLEQCFKHIPGIGFKFYSTHEIVAEYEKSQTANDRVEFSARMTRGTLLFDDLKAERIANNYGHNDVFTEVLEQRYHKSLLTHLTCNYAKESPNNVEQALVEIGERYGDRVYDRIFDMFNIIEFKGNSLRR